MHRSNYYNLKENLSDRGTPRYNETMPSNGRWNLQDNVENILLSRKRSSVSGLFLAVVRTGTSEVSGSESNQEQIRFCRISKQYCWLCGTATFCAGGGHKNGLLRSAR